MSSPRKKWSDNSWIKQGNKTSSSLDNTNPTARYVASHRRKKFSDGDWIKRRTSSRERSDRRLNLDATAPPRLADISTLDSTVETVESSRDGSSTGNDDPVFVVPIRNKPKPKPTEEAPSESKHTSRSSKYSSEKKERPKVRKTKELPSLEPEAEDEKAAKSSKSPDKKEKKKSKKSKEDPEAAEVSSEKSGRSRRSARTKSPVERKRSKSKSRSGRKIRSKYLESTTPEAEDPTTTTTKDSSVDYLKHRKALKKTKEKSSTSAFPKEEADKDSGNFFKNRKELKKTKEKPSSSDSPNEEVDKDSGTYLKHRKELKKAKKKSKEVESSTFSKAKDAGDNYLNLRKDLKKTKTKITTATSMIYPKASAEGSKPETAKAAPTTKKKASGKSSCKTVLVLISSYTTTLEQRSNQERALTILKGLKLGDDAMEVVDGARPDNKDRRNELFGVSGTRAQYPQFFMVCGKSGQTEFLADWDGFEAMNDAGTLEGTLMAP